MTLLPAHQQQQERERDNLTHRSFSPVSSHHLQLVNTGEPEDLRISYNSKMEEIAKTPIKHVLKRTCSSEDNNGNCPEEGAEKKRQRVESIVTNICQPRSPKSHDINANNEQQRNKRKQFVPQQHGSLSNGGSQCNGEIDVVSEDTADCTEEMSKPSGSPTQLTDNGIENTDHLRERKENALLKNQIKIMSEQLQKNQQITHELTEKMKLERYELMTARLALHQPQFEMDACIKAIRAEINQAVKLAFKDAFEKHSTSYSKEKSLPSSTIRETNHREINPVQNSSNTIHVPEIKRSSSTLPPVPSPHITASAPPAHHSLTNPLLPLPLYYGPTLSAPSHAFSSANQLTSQLNNNMMSAQLFQAAMENELIESQLRDRENQLNKKKRTKVTDTRLSPRTSKHNENSSPPSKQESAPDPAKLFDSYGPSSALFPSINPSVAAMQSVLFSGLCAPQPESLRGHIGGGTRSPANLSDNSDHCEPSSPEMSLSLHSALPGQNVTLTPLHLRKAKLMFFYVRYPSSVLLKNYFCDVHFNKNNTAQLVKWFSNFREFYYIQMEKYARQSIAEGLSADQVEVTTESELYKILNLHYNRNNQIEVPKSFLDTIQTTLREFFRAIAVGKDREQSWKKPIYKVIARLDDIVPEYFKSQDWMEQLSD